MTLPDFITAGAVAQIVGLDNAAAFLRRRAAMETDLHFPQPMPLSRSPMRWRRDRVVHWVAEQGLPIAATANLPPRPQGPNVVLMEMARTA